MNETQLNTAMAIQSTFTEANLAAKTAGNSIMQLLTSGSYFISPEEDAIIRAAMVVLADIEKRTSIYEAFKFAQSKIQNSTL